MERAEAEAIYDAGRERVVEVLLDLVGRLGGVEDRLGRVEGKQGESSRNSSTPPSADPPKTRQQRRALARAKAKELLKDKEPRKQGAQKGHRQRDQTLPTGFEVRSSMVRSAAVTGAQLSSSALK